MYHKIPHKLLVEEVLENDLVLPMYLFIDRYKNQEREYVFTLGMFFEQYSILNNGRSMAKVKDAYAILQRVGIIHKDLLADSMNTYTFGKLEEVDSHYVILHDYEFNCIVNNVEHKNYINFRCLSVFLAIKKEAKCISTARNEFTTAKIKYGEISNVTGVANRETVGNYIKYLSDSGVLIVSNGVVRLSSGDARNNNVYSFVPMEHKLLLKNMWKIGKK